MFKFAKFYAAKEGDSPDLVFQKELMVIISTFLFFCGVIWCLQWYLIFGWVIPTYAAGAFGLMVGIMIFVSHYFRNHYLLVHSVFLGTIIVPVVCQWSIGSMHQSGMIIAWAFLTPLGVLIFSSIRPAIVYMVIFIACIMITAIYEPLLYGHPMEVNDSIIQLFYCMNLGTSFTVIFATCAWFVNTIKIEKKYSDELLLNILPRDVAEELKRFGMVEPRDHIDATVLFTDFKDFTELSETITAKELVEEINHCFGVFDEITSRYHIEKIKTIGDSYMAVGGNFSLSQCRPIDVVMAAVEMSNYVLKRKEERRAIKKFYFEMRLGIHTGPVISGVVGVKKFQFDIWGDTVNIASRMETNSEIGALNISETTYKLVKDYFSFEYRGKIPVKGKGEMAMYFVKEALPLDKQPVSA